MDFSFNLPFCLLLPDGDFPVKLKSGEIVTLRLELHIPESYDEKIVMRGITKKDIEGVKELRILITDNDYQGQRGQIIPAEQIWTTKESGHILEFRFDDSSKNYSPKTPILFNSELHKDRLGRFRYSRVTFIYENLSGKYELSLCHEGI